ncbi:YfeC-like transcriptional regulator, partial [Klebsiella pneumoniae]|uniref:YfeC-like transcriptional regulator n=1 Tax=Klebsiella pneumoniae TaxID=573 RepID=UPI0031359AE7
MTLEAKMPPAGLPERQGEAEEPRNRWYRDKEARNGANPGVNGGRVRLMVIDQPVRGGLPNIPATRRLLTDNHPAEAPGAYLV